MSAAAGKLLGLESIAEDARRRYYHERVKPMSDLLGYPATEPKDNNTGRVVELSRVLAQGYCATTNRAVPTRLGNRRE